MGGIPDPERNAKIIKLWNGGLNQTQLAQRFPGADISSVLKKARADGLQVRSGRPGVKWPHEG